MSRCEEGEHNDLATLFLSSTHHTIINLFSMGHNPGEAYVVHFTQSSLALFVVIFLILMSVGAGVAIPGGLFMPSIMVRHDLSCLMSCVAYCCRVILSLQHASCRWQISLWKIILMTSMLLAGGGCLGWSMGICTSGLAAALECAAGSIWHHGSIQCACRRVQVGPLRCLQQSQ